MLILIAAETTPPPQVIVWWYLIAGGAAVTIVGIIKFVFWVMNQIPSRREHDALERRIDKLETQQLQSVTDVARTDKNFSLIAEFIKKSNK